MWACGVIAGVLVASIIVLSATAAETEPEGVTTPPEASAPLLPSPLNAFEVSAIHGLRQLAVQHFRAGRYEASEALLRQVVKKYPQAPVPHYLLASLLARFGRPADAVASLRTAVANGFRGIDTLDRDPYLASLRETAAFSELVATLRERAATADPTASPTQIEPAAIEDGVALVDLGNTIWDPRIEGLRSFFRFAGGPPAISSIAVPTPQRFASTTCTRSAGRPGITATFTTIATAITQTYRPIVCRNSLMSNMRRRLRKPAFTSVFTPTISLMPSPLAIHRLL